MAAMSNAQSSALYTVLTHDGVGTMRRCSDTKRARCGEQAQHSHQGRAHHCASSGATSGTPGTRMPSGRPFAVAR